MKIPSNWTFETSEVAKGFDRHVREQLPWYDLVTGLISHIGRHYIPEHGLVYDFGASTGNIGNSLHEVIKTREARFVAVEKSKEMAALYTGPGAILVDDATKVNICPHDLSICFLLLMFIPIELRKGFLDRIYNNLKEGGAILIVDKLSINAGYISTILHRLTIAGKVSTGVRPDEIIAKEISLGGVQRPLKDGQIESWFPHAVQIFRFGEFVGWLIEKE